jgi:hypothetical protein
MRGVARELLVEPAIERQANSAVTLAVGQIASRPMSPWPVIKRD